MSADYRIEDRILENRPTGLERAEIERLVGNPHNRLLRQQQDSKALSASKGTTTVDCGEKNRRLRNRFEGNCFSCGRRCHRAEECRSAKKIEKTGNVSHPTKMAEKAHDMMEVHRVLARPSEEITQTTAQARGIATTGQWGFCEARLQVEAKRQAV